MVDIRTNALTMLAEAYEEDQDEEEDNKRILSSTELRDEEDNESKSMCPAKRLKSNFKESFLPLPDEVTAMFKNEISQEDNSNLHEGRIRSFPAKRGNWTSFIYIPFEILNQGGFEQLYDYISNSTPNPHGSIHKILNPHLSLSKTVVLRHHWIDSFITSLQDKLVRSNTTVDLVLDTMDIYVNDEKTRTFLGLNVLPTRDLLALVESCDFCLSEFNLESYYKTPSFHISLAWMIGDQSTSSVLQNYRANVCNYWDKICDNDPSLRTLNTNTLELKTGNNIYKLRLTGTT